MSKRRDGKKNGNGKQRKKKNKRLIDLAAVTASDASFPETRYEKRVAADIRGKGEKAKRWHGDREEEERKRERRKRKRQREKRYIDKDSRTRIRTRMERVGIERN